MKKALCANQYAYCTLIDRKIIPRNPINWFQRVWTCLAATNLLVFGNLKQTVTLVTMMGYTSFSPSLTGSVTLTLNLGSNGSYTVDGVEASVRSSVLPKSEVGLS